MNQQTSEAPPPDIGASTGNTRVDAVLGRLQGLETMDLGDRAVAFAEMEADLAAFLDSDEDAGTPTDLR